jgi:hypothetical protein
LLNLNRDIDLPFIFGGDGSTVAIPPQLREPARGALQSVRQVAQSNFGLNLRIGIVPVSDLYSAGHDLRLAKFMASPEYSQAIFSGTGIAAAERLVKKEGTYVLQEVVDSSVNANLSGLECRWRDVPSPAGETLSLIVQATSNSPAESFQTYQKLLAKLSVIYGSEQNYQPVTHDDLGLTISPFNLIAESRAVSHTKSLPAIVCRSLALWLQHFYLYINPYAKLTSSGLTLKGYRSLIANSTDYRKFDETLRMILSSSPKQRKELVTYLETEHTAAKLAFGLHISNRSHLTCIVMKRDGKQVHFVDGAGGGYTMAARNLKSQLSTS